jgi:hypothetical protein
LGSRISIKGVAQGAGDPFRVAWAVKVLRRHYRRRRVARRGIGAGLNGTVEEPDWLFTYTM